MTSKLVWCTSAGYPADYNYREYYRDIGHDLDQQYLAPFQYAAGVRSATGIKYHRITGKTQDKHLYNPDWASGTAARHARDFVHRCRDQAERVGPRMPFPCTIVSPYDAELFGHWWFEGPQWIYHVFRELASTENLKPGTPGDFLRDHPIQQKAMPAQSSWGRNGYHEHWVNPKAAWMWQPLHEAAVRMRQVADRQAKHPPARGSLEERALRQAGRELMLAQSSDWPFTVTNGTTVEYAVRRFNDHLNRFHSLVSDVEGQVIAVERLQALEYMDSLFPELDYRLFATHAG
jgi:1,4-alpha-glucan branching enzyme